MECSKTMAVVAGHLVAGSAEVEPSVRQDVLDSLLFSQLFADGKCAKFDASVQWLAEHDNALRHSKWTLSNLRTNELKLRDPQRLDLARLLDDELLSRLPRVAADDVRAMLKGIGASQHDEAPQLLFRDHALKVLSDEIPDDSLPVDPAEPPAPRVTVVALMLSYMAPGEVLYTCVVTFKTTEAVEGNLFEQSFTGSQIVSPVDIRFIERHLDIDAFAKVRGDVQRFLAVSRDGLILPLCCAEPDEPDEPEVTLNG